MNEAIVTVFFLIGIPVYLYFLLRWLGGAMFRSYFEIRREFLREERVEQEKKECINKHKQQEV